jgi:hypothetical protein
MNMNVKSLRFEWGVVLVILVLVLIYACGCIGGKETKYMGNYFHCFRTGNPQHGKYYNIVFNGISSCFVHQQKREPGNDWDAFAYSTNISQELRSLLIRYAYMRPKRKPPKVVVPGTRLSYRTRFCKKDAADRDITVFFHDEFLELEQRINEEICKDENIVYTPPRWIIENEHLRKRFSPPFVKESLLRAPQEIQEDKGAHH